MLPLYDMMTKAQNGRFAELLARQVNLTRQQVELAMETVLPAFSEAVKQKAHDPMGFARLMATMAGGPFARFFEPGGAPSLDGDAAAAGNRMLTELFGTSELTRAVAEQTAKATGIAQESMARLMPLMAVGMAGGFWHQAREAASTGTANPFLDGFTRMAPAGGANPYAQMMERMFATPGQERASAENPFLAIYQEWAKGFEPPAPPPEPEPEKAEPKNALPPFFAEMFETGLRQQSAYEETMRRLVRDFTQPAAGRKKGPTSG